MQNSLFKSLYWHWLGCEPQANTDSQNYNAEKLDTSELSNHNDISCNNSLSVWTFDHKLTAQLHRINSDGNYTGSTQMATTQDQLRWRLHRINSDGNDTGSTQMATHRINSDGNYAASTDRLIKSSSPTNLLAEFEGHTRTYLIILISTNLQLRWSITQLRMYNQ